jgi:prophage antirepressor-like protein
MSNLIVKEFNGSKIHTFMWNNKPCWIANEIVSIFDYADPSKTIQQCIKAEEFEIGVEYDILKGNDLKTFKEFVSKVTTVEVVTQLKYVPQLTIFYEDGMYGFLQYTDKPIGVAFRKWLRREVLPEIRKTGKYIRSKEDATQSNQYWFIKWYKGRPIITLHDFKKLTGIELSGRKPFFREEYFTAGYDWNGLGKDR